MTKTEIEPELLDDDFTDDLEEPEFEEEVEITPEMEEVADGLIEEGFDPSEVEEMLFDPAPRRRRGRRRRKSTRRYDPAPRRRRRTRRRSRRYDPAPRARSAYPRRRKGYRRRAKGALGKLKKYVMPGVAGLTFYGAYQQRSKDLLAAGSITKDSVFDAIMYDVKNFNGADAMTRLQDNATEIITPVIGSVIVKAVKPGGQIGKVAGIMADALMGYATGKFGKVVLDPPMAQSKVIGRQVEKKAISPTVTPAVVDNPYYN